MILYNMKKCVKMTNCNKLQKLIQLLQYKTQPVGKNWLFDECLGPLSYTLLRMQCTSMCVVLLIKTSYPLTNTV